MLALGLTGSPCEVGASTLSWHYRLIEGSEWVDDCEVCARPTLILPLRGQFTVVLVEETPISSRFEVRDVRFHTGTGADSDYRMTGSGMLGIGGEVVLRQDLRLDLHLEGDGTTIDRVFTNDVDTVNRPWPMLEVALSDVEGTPAQTYRLSLRAAPLREIWFSTVSGMTSGNSDPPFARISFGDLLSGDGRVVRANQELVGQLGFMPPTPEVGVDAFEVQPGGEIWYSLSESRFSETLGMLQEGDLLSEQGRVVKRNQQLTEAFQFAGEPTDLGLDAVHVLSDGEIWYSVRTAAYSERLGVTVTAGDVLSDRGYVVRSLEGLLANFKPVEPEAELGLDAIYVWLSGEFWFSVETGFIDSALGWVQPGDILSDQGFIAIRNLDLTLGFSPLEDLADFGLDGVWVVTDIGPPMLQPTVLELPRLTGNDVDLEWMGSGRVYQLERASDPAGPYIPLSPILPALQWRDRIESPRGSHFYRVSQW